MCVPAHLVAAVRVRFPSSRVMVDAKNERIVLVNDAGDETGFPLVLLKMADARGKLKETLDSLAEHNPGFA